MRMWRVALRRDVERRAHGTRVGDARRWLALGVVAMLLAACEHGNVSYNRSTGTWALPFGHGSAGQNRSD